MAGSNPTAWAEYIAALPSRDAIDKQLARFRARYRLAGSLESVTFIGYGHATADGYTAALRVGLAYSALETLESSGRVGERAVAVLDADLRDRYLSQRLTKLRGWIQGEKFNGKLQQRLDALVAGGIDDVRSLAEAIRHKTFHGGLSAHGTGVATSKTTLAFLDDLAQAVLAASDREFSRLVMVENAGAKVAQ